MPQGYYTVPEASAKLGVSQEDFLRTVSSAGLKKYQDEGQLVFKTEDIDRLAASKPPAGGGPGVFQSSSSGLFDVDDLMAELGTATGKPAAPAGAAASDEPTVMAGGGKTGKPPAAAGRPGSGAVMSDSGLFNVKELVQEADIISKNTVTDDTTVVEPTGKKKPGGGAVMSDSGLFDVREAVGDTTEIRQGAPGAPGGPPPVPASKPPLSRGAVMSDSGVFNIQSNVEQMAAPAAAAGAAPKAPAPSLEGALSSGAVMSDSGLFDVRDLVSEADAAKAGGKGDAPTKTVKAASAYSRPTTISPTGGSDSGLFTPTDDEKTRPAMPVRGPAPAGSKGITIFDPEDFNVNKFADPSAATAAMGQQAGAFAAPAPTRRDARQGSGAGLRAPAAAREGTSLGGEVMPRSASGSAIFSGEGRTAPAHAQTEVNFASPRSSTSGIFGSQGRAPANMQTAILDAQPVDESTEGNVDTSTQPQLVAPRRGAARTSPGRSQTVAALTPVQAEAVDHYEPFYAFFMFVVIVLLSIGAIMKIFSMGGLQPDFIRGFVNNGKFVLIGGGVVLLIGLFASWVWARNKGG
jgi:hypothetical protein